MDINGGYWSKKLHSYSRVNSEEDGSSPENDEKSDAQRWHSLYFLLICLSCAAAFAASITLGILFLTPTLQQEINSSKSAHTCHDPVRRKEWRSLDHKEREDYLKAVTCLSTKKSRLGLRQSLHDDFAYVHVWMANDGEPPFLSLWSFLSVYHGFLCTIAYA